MFKIWYLCIHENNQHSNKIENKDGTRKAVSILKCLIHKYLLCI